MMMKQIKGGVGPNLFKLAEYGSLAPNPLYGPQFFKWTGETRPAKKGEWFISGNPAEAYYCTHDHTYEGAADHIAVPVEEPAKTIVVNGITYNRGC
jgi:hypothetical protein